MQADNIKDVTNDNGKLADFQYYNQSDDFDNITQEVIVDLIVSILRNRANEQGDKS